MIVDLGEVLDGVLVCVDKFGVVLVLGVVEFSVWCYCGVFG